MTNLTYLAKDLQTLVGWQRTPEPLTQSDYEWCVVEGLKTLYIDTGRAEVFDESKIILDVDLYYDEDLKIDEKRYILLVAQILFYQRVQSDVNNIVGYTTDALSVTNADKPYANLKDSIERLENERRIVFYKMTSYSFYIG